MTDEQRRELQRLVAAYLAHQVIVPAGPVEPLIAEEMEKRDKEEKRARQEVKEARGQTIGNSLLKASNQIMQATKEASKMYLSLHRQVMDKLEDLHGYQSPSEDTTEVSEYSESESEESTSSNSDE